MVRWLLLLMLAVVPAQLVWAAAASYCLHEAAAASQDHPGHHEHRHPGSDPTDDLDATADADCEVCQLAAAASIPVALPAMRLQPQVLPRCEPEALYPSHLGSGPEPPDWPGAAPAARFAGGAASGPHSPV